MNTRKKFIGASLIRQRNKKNMSQKDVVTVAGMSQSHYSKIESDHQAASEEQIAAFAQILELSPEELTGLNTVVINEHVETQHGGNANSYVIQHHSEELLAAKEDLIMSLREQIVIQNVLLATKDEAIARLKRESGTGT